MYRIHYKYPNATNFEGGGNPYRTEAEARERIGALLKVTPSLVIHLTKTIAVFTSTPHIVETRHDTAQPDANRTDSPDQSADQPDSHADDGHAS